MEILHKYFPGLNPSQISQFQQLGSQYQEWNEKINVLSRKDIAQIYERHVLHSLSIAKYVEFKDACQIMDLGTGGGFPGLPLAILFPKANFLLVDSIGKKIKVVEAISNALELKNVVAYNGRAEEIKTRFNFIVTRAVAPLPKLLSWTRNKYLSGSAATISNGLIALKGGDLKLETAGLTKKMKLKSLSDYYEEAFFTSKKIIYIPAV